MSTQQELREEALRAPVLSKKLIDTMLESAAYTTISFVNWTVEILGIIKTRIDRGDVITDEVSKITYDKKNFAEFVKKNFSPYVYSQTFDEANKAEKIYFQLEACEGGYQLVMADSSTNKVYQWISSLNERFSLVRMIATDVVYVKDNKGSSYAPFISENGKYCRYEEETGKLVEIV